MRRRGGLETYREFHYFEIGVVRDGNFLPAPGPGIHLLGALADGNTIQHIVTSESCYQKVFSFVHGNWLELTSDVSTCYGLVEELIPDHPLQVVPHCPHG